jgi:multicomponent Na+:H+ antiporter subunit D
VLAAGVIGLAVTIYSVVDIDKLRQSHAYYPLLQVLLAGVSAAFLTGDIFNLYVWFEVMLISSFVLMALGSERKQLEGALKYVTINLISSFLLLSAVGFLYGAVGTLNMADAAVKLRTFDNPNLINTLAMLFLTTFGIKAAVFPLFFWLPASYHTPPAAVSAIFGGLLTKVGVYALIRFFTLLFTHNVDFTHGLILLISGLTMITGVLGAVAQTKFRRILSFHIISQIGYMTLGLGLLTAWGLAASIFFVIHNMIAKTNLFLVSGVVHGLRGTYRLDRLGDLYREKPYLAMCFAVPAFSLAGVPPLSGFVAKLLIVLAGLEAGAYAIVAVAVAVSLLTLYSMVKIWNEVFWKPVPRDNGTDSEQTAGEHRPGTLSMPEQAVLMTPIAGLCVLTILIGVLGAWLFSITQAAADELLHPELYIQAVLGASR